MKTNSAAIVVTFLSISFFLPGKCQADLSALNALPVGEKLAALMEGKGSVTIENGKYTVNGTLHVPDGVTISLEKSERLTVNGGVKACRCRIFLGSGRVRISNTGDSHPLFPEWWGAYSDKSHPSVTRSAIQEAFNSIEGSGGQVSLAKGVYLVDGSIYIGRTQSTTMYGFGDESVLTPIDERTEFLAADAKVGSDQIKTTGGLSKFTEGGSVLVRDNASREGGANHFHKVRNIDNKNNTLTLTSNIQERSYFRSKKAMIATVFPVLVVAASSGIHLENFKIDGNRGAISDYTWKQAGISLYDIQDSKISNMTIENASYESILIISSKDIILEGNQITNSAWRGIHFGDSSEIIVRGNDISGTGYDGIYFCERNSHIEVTENIITEAGTGIGGIGRWGYKDNAGDHHITITHNVISKSGSYGIIMYDSAYNVVENNTISNGSQAKPEEFAGILIRGSSHNRVFRNLVFDDQKTSTQRLGIHEMETSANNEIQSNRAYGNHDQSYLLKGKDTVATDNVTLKWQEFMVLLRKSVQWW